MSAVDIGCSESGAENFLNMYWARFPRFRAWMKSQIRFCRDHGYVRTLTGRYRRIPEIRSSEFWKQSHAERQTLNSLDAETEALTQRGWVPGFKLRRDDVLLTKNPDSGEMEWQRMTGLGLRREYNGPLVEFKSRTFSAVTTPAHRWLVDTNGGGRNEERTTATLSMWGDHRIHRAGRYVGPHTATYSDDFVELAGWVLTDGSYKHAKTYNTTGVYVCQSARAKPDEVRQIDELFARLGLKVYRRQIDWSQCVYWTFFGEMAVELRRLFPQRHLTMDFLLKLTRPQLDLLLDTMMLGDGHAERSTATQGGKLRFYAGTQMKGDMFQVLALLQDQASTLTYRDLSKYSPVSEKMPNVPKMNGIWIVTVLRRDKVQVLHRQSRRFEARQGVWCPEVPNSFFVARRKGCVYVTGSS